MDEVTDGIERVSLENGGHQSDLDINDLSGLPSILIVTNIADGVFDEDAVREEFQRPFLEFDPAATFSYLKNFRRARVNFTSAVCAAKARIHLHEDTVCGKVIKCYFAQPLEEEESPSQPHLQPPAPTRQFLISPPASPPVGWEPVLEAQPVLNYDLIAALANLAPGESHELHPPSDKHPGIVVHICEDPAGFADRPKLLQTRCPERQS